MLHECKVSCTDNQGQQKVGDAHLKIFAKPGETVSVLYRVSNLSDKNWPMNLGVRLICEDWPIEMKNLNTSEFAGNCDVLLTLRLVIPKDLDKKEIRIIFELNKEDDPAYSFSAD